MWQNFLNEFYSKISKFSNNFYQTISPIMNNFISNEIWRSTVLTFISTLVIKRESENYIDKYKRATFLTSIYLFNEFLKKEKIVNNDNLVFSSKITLITYCHYPSNALLASATSFGTSYLGLEYLSKNDVDYFQLIDNASELGIAGSSGLAVYKLLNNIDVQNPAIKFSMVIPIIAVIYKGLNFSGNSYHLLDQIMPLNETYTAYNMFQKFSNKEELDTDIKKLAHTIIISGLASGALLNYNIIEGAKLAQEILKINKDLTFEVFLKLTKDYIVFSLIPTAIQYIILDTLYTKERDEITKKYSLKFIDYAESEGIVTLHNSDFTITQFDEKIVKTTADTSNLFHDIANSTPDLLLVLRVAINHTPTIAFGLGSLSTIIYLTSSANDFLSNNIIKLRKELDLLKSKIVKVTEHDVINSKIINDDPQLNQMTNDIWNNIFEKQRTTEANLHIFEGIHDKFQYFSQSYVYSLKQSCAQIFTVYLIYKKAINPEEVLVYSSAMSQLLDTSSFRLTKKSKLAELSSDIQVLLNFTSKIEQNSISSKNITFIQNHDNLPIYVKSLSYARGYDSNKINIQIEDSKFEKGHVCAITGGNGSGKSSFFDLLISQGQILDNLGFNQCDGEIQISTQDLVLINQDLYCSLFITPFQWLVKMTKSELSQLTEEESSELRYKISTYSKKLELLHEDGNNNLESILNIKQDNWYEMLSGGEKIKVELIRQVFLKDTCPDILLLDEIFGPLDPNTKLTVMNEIKDFCPESTILVIYHNEKECVDDGFFTDNLHFSNGEANFRDIC